jgi:hypothetical protein
MNPKQDYLVRELWILAWSASVQRARLYRPGRDLNSRETQHFQDKLFGFLSREVIPKYRDRVEEEQHYEQIDDLIACANNAGKQVLGDRGYKYGIAQKLLNLFLKYHWCLGTVAEPPHCPVDRIVIENTTYKGKVNWTDLVGRSQYQMIIEDIRRQAKPQSIATWELSIFNRRRVHHDHLDS